MKSIVFNSQTRETEIIEVPDVEPIIDQHQEPTIEERVTAVEDALTALMGV